MKEKLLEILSSIRPEGNFIESKDFVKEGLLDSMDIVNLVEELEEEFDIDIPATEISIKNFSNLDGIVELIEKTKG